MGTFIPNPETQSGEPFCKFCTEMRPMRSSMSLEEPWVCNSTPCVRRRGVVSALKREDEREAIISVGPHARLVGLAKFWKEESDSWRQRAEEAEMALTRIQNILGEMDSGA